MMNNMPARLRTHRIGNGYRWTQQRTLTRRGVIWPGYACNVRCVFCYNTDMKMPWRLFDAHGGLKEQLEEMRFRYGNQHVDFMGGEFTLHPEVIRTITFCREIGLRPTVITNALKLADREFAKKMKDAGIEDFLISLHGVGGTIDRIFNIGEKNAYASQLQAIDNLRELDIPFRFNVTLIKWNKEDLPGIARVAAEKGALVVNWLNFNPHFSFSDQLDIDFQARYSEIVPSLREAIDICEANGIEANVRYVPFCTMKGYEKHIYHCRQLPYDHHEWDYNSWHRDEAPLAEPEYYAKAALIRAHQNGSEQCASCSTCALRHVCDGFNIQYTRTFGEDEVRPYQDSPVRDPTHFISQQWKIEELD
jgi:MoaA/NifB/PqqE/SkfB family radical SAM enzyme